MAQTRMEAPTFEPVKFVPWEPYKAACGEVRSNSTNEPLLPNNLTPYQLSADIPISCRPQLLLESLENEIVKISGLEAANIKASVVKKMTQEEKDKEELINELRILRKELDVERGINSELKKLLVHTLTEDVNCKITSLTEDKVRLAKNIDVYHNRVQNDAENTDNLKNENSLWKSKFMAIAIRADDLAYSLHHALGLFRKAQNVIVELSSHTVKIGSELKSTVAELLGIDVITLYKKSPCCDEKKPGKPAFSSSITITCCHRCADKEIRLI